MKGDFSEQFEKHVDRLDYYFHQKVRNARIADDIEALKKDLIQDTALAVLTKLQNEKYNDYSINALIWIKAPDVWREYRRSLRTQIPVAMSIEDLQPAALVSDPQTKYDSLLESIRPVSGKELQGWRMLVLHLGGYRYKEIAEMFHSTESAVKEAVYRFRTRQKHP